MLNSDEIGEESVFGLGEDDAPDYSQGLPTMGSDPGPTVTKGPSQYPATADDSGDILSQVKVFFMGPNNRQYALGETALGVAVFALGWTTWKHTHGWGKALNLSALFVGGMIAYGSIQDATR